MCLTEVIQTIFVELLILLHQFQFIEYLAIVYHFLLNLLEKKTNVL